MKISHQNRELDKMANGSLKRYFSAMYRAARVEFGRLFPVTEVLHG